MEDEYEGETGKSSVKWESDLASLKPRSDVRVRAIAHAPHGTPTASCPAHVRVLDAGTMVIVKGLRVTVPRSFTKGWRGWKLGEPRPTRAVPVRWEQAYGGTSRVALAPSAKGASAELKLNEVCFPDPLGCAWVKKCFLDQAAH
ncbi:DUF2169 domain-containing protein [Burkholderia territorii]|uniref:DUF2169 domain-containing protein n=1 Tax=Burkholderia territorii TaxID=1503055 RepID=UPI0009BFB4EB|nr:DUF2169 domain-containing protein [Burkholderia territorii]TXG23659.1 DUF2169 domain-containing protein [Burkholderia territorii]